MASGNHFLKVLWHVRDGNVTLKVSGIRLCLKIATEAFSV